MPRDRNVINVRSLCDDVVQMPLYLIGLGLGDEKDVTVKGAEAIAKCSKVFLESYTSVLGVDAKKLVCVSIHVAGVRVRICACLCMYVCINVCIN